MYDPASLTYSAPPWYIIEATWMGGHTVRHTTDNPRLADVLITTFRKSPYTGRVFVTTTYQEPPEERAKREAWEAYLEGVAANGPDIPEGWSIILPAK